MTSVVAPVGVDPEQLSPADARELTDQIKNIVGVAWELICAAYEGRAWIALGHESWDAYCATEFDGARLAMPREDRREVVASLRESGLSQRAIASAVGISRDTVQSDLAAAQVDRIGPPDEQESDDMDVMDKLRAAAAEAAAKKITGTDGKRYLDKSRAAVDARIGKAKAMAKEGYTSRQIAAALDMRVDVLKEFCTRHGIEVPADVTVGKTRRLDHDRIVSEAVHSLDGIVMGLDLVDPDTLDPDQIEGWSTSLRASITSLTKFSKRLKEINQ